MGLDKIGTMLLIAGAILVTSGLLAILMGKTGFIGKLPGDIVIQRGNFTLYFPLATFIVLSVVLTIVANIAVRLLR